LVIVARRLAIAEVIGPAERGIDLLVIRDEAQDDVERLLAHGLRGELVLAVVGLIALIRWLYRVTFGRRKKPSAKTETPLFTATPLPPSPPRIDQTPALEQTPTSSMQQPQIVEPKPSMQPSAAVSTNPSDRTYCPKCNQETCAMVRFCPECGYQLRSD
jgi:type IV secretory pathway VirB10-like protein